MADPRIAICFPAAPTQAGYEMVRRSVHALRAQDCDPSLFEVVVAVDGGELAGIDHHHPFALRIVTSPRTPDAMVVEQSEQFGPFVRLVPGKETP